MYAGSEAEIVDFEELSEKAEEVEQTDLEAKQAEFRENNPDVVADFRAKTEENLGSFKSAITISIALRMVISGLS